MSRLRRLVQLNRLERSLLLRAAAWIALARVGLACLPFPRLRALCDRLSARARISGATPEQARWAVLAIATRVPGTRCLPRALALQCLLRQCGFASELRLGVTKDEARGFAAHAWVDFEGRSLLAGDDLGYTPLATFPG